MIILFAGSSSKEEWDIGSVEGRGNAMHDWQ